MQTKVEALLWTIEFLCIDECFYSRIRNSWSIYPLFRFPSCIHGLDPCTRITTLCNFGVCVIHVCPILRYNPHAYIGMVGQLTSGPNIFSILIVAQFFDTTNQRLDTSGHWNLHRSKAGMVDVSFSIVQQLMGIYIHIYIYI